MTPALQRSDGHDVTIRLALIRERLAETAAEDRALRAILVLAHELLRERSAATNAAVPAAAPRRPPAAGTPVSPEGYARLVERVRATVSRTIPHGARVLVVSRGDEQLLAGGASTTHFPQDAGGAYAGFYPADGAAAISHLEECRAAGAEFLVLPGVGYWWLEYYGELAQHLLTSSRIAHHDEHCLIFDLRHDQGGTVA